MEADSVTCIDVYPENPTKIAVIPNAAEGDVLPALLQTTPARVAVWRAGCRPLTKAWLQFRADHAVARDAVHSELSDAFLDFARQSQFAIVQSLVKSRQEFVLNPPLGKKVSEETLAELKNTCPSGQVVQIVISDGLSAAAVEANVRQLLPMLNEGLSLSGLTVGRPVVVRYGRVAVADPIAYALEARVVVNLIGERPGLSSGVGLSAYITLNPGPQTISSDRTVVSNIHQRGTPAAEAGAYIVQLITRILDKGVSGVRLQQLG